MFLDWYLSSIIYEKLVIDVDLLFLILCLDALDYCRISRGQSLILAEPSLIEKQLFVALKCHIELMRAGKTTVEEFHACTEYEILNDLDFKESFFSVCFCYLIPGLVRIDMLQ